MVTALAQLAKVYVVLLRAPFAKGISQKVLPISQAKPKNSGDCRQFLQSPLFLSPIFTVFQFLLDSF
jgi:hypothetical protein